MFVPPFILPLLLFTFFFTTNVTEAQGHKALASLGSLASERKDQEERLSTLGESQNTSYLTLSDPQQSDVVATPEEGDIRSLLEEKLPEEFDIPIVFNEAVEYFINYFTTVKRKVFANWLKRSEKYVPFMRQILKEEGLPEDLVYLAMIESGFNPKAYSPAKACGPWQFIYKTGERYGLKVNYWIDERRDPEKSTVAAARYLKDLFNQFGCWYLAAASYNVGEKKVERILEQHNTKDIWEIIKYNSLPKETREYIPKLIAAAIIAKNPEAFGFEKVNYGNPVNFAKFVVPRATPLKNIARAAGVSLETVKSLNPEILRGITPPDREFVIKLPKEVDEQTFYEKISELASREKKVKGYFAYRVKKTDTLHKISTTYGVPKETLCLWNSDRESMRIKPGNIIYIPRFAAEKEIAHLGKERPGTKLAHYRKKGKPGATSKRIIYYRVKKGDTLSLISKRHGVALHSIKSFNNLRGDRIVPGMIIKIPVEKG
ncbi:MAG: transglycosylase SLT domain-containing protein [Desulfobacterota bacterium]|nr:transglycosylase SLT domain-containing protein [Thermodesulfobacteriota bacterium]MDW8001192.1 transglycosylase SLT domain-containing protein [Deltaproteobacteria bacterium]